MIHPDKAYTVAQVAEYIGRSAKTVQKWCAAGHEFPNAISHKGVDGQPIAYRIPGADINAYRHRNRVNA